MVKLLLLNGSFLTFFFFISKQVSACSPFLCLSLSKRSHKMHLMHSSVIKIWNSWNIHTHGGILLSPELISASVCRCSQQKLISFDQVASHLSCELWVYLHLKGSKIPVCLITTHLLRQTHAGWKLILVCCLWRYPFDRSCKRTTMNSFLCLFFLLFFCSSSRAAASSFTALAFSKSLTEQNHPHSFCACVCKL